MSKTWIVLEIFVTSKDERSKVSFRNIFVPSKDEQSKDRFRISVRLGFRVCTKRCSRKPHCYTTQQVFTRVIPAVIIYTSDLFKYVHNSKEFQTAASFD